MLSEIIPVLWHPLGQCTAASANHTIAAHEIIRCKSYNLWSGIIGDATIFTGFMAGISVFWHKHNCHEHGCLKLSWHPDKDGHPICKKHHEDHPSRGLWWDLKRFLKTGHWGDETHPAHNAAKALANRDNAGESVARP